MRHLSGVDASFLHLETPEMPMHVGSLNIFDLPEGYTGDFYEDVKAHIAGRMHLAEVFEHKLAQIPFELSNPVWVDDNDIDIDYHIRRVVLSKPGTFKQLEQLVGRLHSSLLDRSRPLWEFYVIEGLQTGQPAIYAKVHHAAVDGQAGVALAKAIYDLTPEPRPIKAPRARNKGNQYQLGVAELATAAVQNTIQQYVKLFTTLPNAMQAIASATMPAFAGGQFTQFGMPKNWQLGPKTPLNVSITNQRSFAARSVSLAEVKQIAKACGGHRQRCRARGQRGRAAALPRRLQPAPEHAAQRRRARQPARGRQYRPQQPSVDDAGQPRDRHRRSARAAEDHHRLEQGRQGAVGQPQGRDPDRLSLLRRTLDHGRLRAAVRPLAAFPTTCRRSPTSPSPTCPARRCRCTWPAPSSPPTIRCRSRRMAWR